MEEYKRRTRSTDERWFDDADAPSETAEEPSDNRSRQVWQSSRRLTFLLLGLLLLLLLALIYLKDEDPPWDQDLIPPAAPNQPVDASTSARMKAMLKAAAKLPDSDPLLADPWTANLDALGVMLDRNSAVLENFRDLVD